MIKARAGDLLIFGLEKMNVKKLMKGEPMLIDLESIGVSSGQKVLIIYGETKEDIAKELREGFGFENVGVH